MKNRIALFRALPISLALRLLIISMMRRILRLPITFSYAQGAEDIILQYLIRYHFEMSRPGTYVDVGCNAPVKYSNTFELYLQGWRGINIDANTALINECKRVRKEDICVNAAVSDSEREITFYKGKSDLVSTIDETKIVEWKKLFEFSDEDQEVVKTRTLTSILEHYWDDRRDFDLLTIDVEGHDFNVLNGLIRTLPSENSDY